MAAFEYRQAEEIRDVLERHGVRHLFIGKSGAMILGLPDTTQDAALFVETSPAGCAGLVMALRELGFELDAFQEAEVRRGKDFIQLRNGPFDLDLVFAPDGIESFEAAWSRRVETQGFPMCHPRDIIASKAAANRVKEREWLPRLRAFLASWQTQRGKREAIPHLPRNVLRAMMRLLVIGASTQAIAAALAVALLPSRATTSVVVIGVEDTLQLDAASEMSYLRRFMPRGERGCGHLLVRERGVGQEARRLVEFSGSPMIVPGDGGVEWWIEPANQRQHCRDPSTFTDVRTMSYGLPFRSHYYVEAREDVHFATLALAEHRIHYGIQVGSGLVLPFGVHWLGLVGNSVLLGLGGLACLATCQSLLRWRRIKLGRCSQCGYCLRGGDARQCAECGARVRSVQGVSENSRQLARIIHGPTRRSVGLPVNRRGHRESRAPYRDRTVRRRGEPARHGLGRDDRASAAMR